MGLLMSDTMLIDPLLNDSVRLPDTLAEYVYLADLTDDSNEMEGTHRAANPSSWHRLLSWPLTLIASL